MHPAAPIKESTLLVNTTKRGSYDYLSKYGSDWLGHVTRLHNYLLHHGTSATLATLLHCYSIHLYCYTGATHIFLLLHGCYTIATQVLHHTSLLLHGATPYISIATRVLHHTSLLLHGCYTIHLYCYMGATQ